MKSMGKNKTIANDGLIPQSAHFVRNNSLTGFTRLTQKQIKWLIFIVSLAVYIIFSLRAFRFDPQGDFKYYLLTGDEPHYLLITHSLVFDKDFNLFNNQQQNDWRYFEERPIDGHAPGFKYYNNLAKGRLESKEKLWENKRYSVHRIGLPLALGPAYLVGFKWNLRIRWVVVLFLNICAALIAVNIYSLGFEVTRNRFISLAICLFLSFSAPILFYSNKIFPDLLAGLVIIFSYRKIRNSIQWRFLNPFLIGLCIAYLPWLHERFILTSIILFLFFIFKVRFSLKPIIISLVPIGISLILQASYYHLLFGVLYPINVHPSFSLKYGLQHGLPGLILDQNHGLFLYSPIYITALVGTVGWMKENPKELLWLSLIVLPNYIMLGLFRDWGGGLCPPIRYLMPIAPLLAGPIAYSLYRIKNFSFRISVLLMAIVGIFIAFYGMWQPGLLYRYTHPVISYFSKFVNLTILFPNFIDTNKSTYGLSLFWLLVIIGFSLYYAYKGFWKKALS